MRHYLAAFIASLALCGTAAAEPVFKENFDAAIYTEGAPLPTEVGLLSHGRWMPLGKGNYPGVVQVEDGSPCAALHVPRAEVKENAARIIGVFGRDGNDRTAVAEGIRLRLNFKCSALLNETFFIQILGSDGKSRASVGMSADGRITFSFGGKRQMPEIGFQPGRWYTLELTMPPSPGTLSTYKAALYEKGAATPLVEKSGRVARSVEPGGEKYISFEAMHRVPGETLYVDDIEVETLSEQH